MSQLSRQHYLDERSIGTCCSSACWSQRHLVESAVLAPRETTMGEPQRIVYIHVAVAWFGMVGFIGHGRMRPAVLAAARAGVGPLGPGAAPKWAGCAPA